MFGIYLVKTAAGNLALSCVFGAVSTMGYNALDCLGAELFPTRLRCVATPPSCKAVVDSTTAPICGVAVVGSPTVPSCGVAVLGALWCGYCVALEGSNVPRCGSCVAMVIFVPSINILKKSSYYFS